MLQAQQNALQQKLDTVEYLIQALEQYAGHLKAADRAPLDWEAAAELAKLNPWFTDLVAGTAADAAETLLLADIPADNTN